MCFCDMCLKKYFNVIISFNKFPVLNQVFIFKSDYSSELLMKKIKLHSSSRTNHLNYCLLTKYLKVECCYLVRIKN